MALFTKALLITVGDVQSNPLDDEHSEIQDALDAHDPFRFQVRYFVRHANTLAQMRFLIVEIRPHILHLAGHCVDGKFLMFENENCDLADVATHLKDATSPQTLLVANFSHSQILVQNFAIPDRAAVGFSDINMCDAFAKSFAKNFYNQLCLARSVGECATETRRQMIHEGRFAHFMLGDNCKMQVSGGDLILPHMRPRSQEIFRPCPSPFRLCILVLHFGQYSDCEKIYERHEMHSLVDKLDPRAERVTLRVHQAPSLDSVRDLLQRLRPHVLFLTGFGKRRQLQFGQGQGEMADASTILDALDSAPDSRLRLIVGACHDSKNLATLAAQRGYDAIGAEGRIESANYTRFSMRLLREISQGQSSEEAFSDALSTLGLGVQPAVQQAQAQGNARMFYWNPASGQRRGETSMMPFLMVLPDPSAHPVGSQALQRQWLLCSPNPDQMHTALERFSPRFVYFHPHSPPELYTMAIAHPSVAGVMVDGFPLAGGLPPGKWVLCHSPGNQMQITKELLNCFAERFWIALWLGLGVERSVAVATLHVAKRRQEHQQQQLRGEQVVQGSELGHGPENAAAAATADWAADAAVVGGLGESGLKPYTLFQSGRCNVLADMHIGDRAWSDKVWGQYVEAAIVRSNQ